MRLIAVAHQLTGDYGTVTAGQEFEVNDEVAAELMRNGSARRADPPRVLYDTKVIVPEAPQVGPRQHPFRDLSLPNPEPPPVAPASHRVLSDTDLPESGVVDSGRRGKR